MQGDQLEGCSMAQARDNELLDLCDGKKRAWKMELDEQY